MINENEESDQLTGFEAKLRSIESLIEKAMHLNSNVTLNINIYDGAKIGQQIDHTETSNMWMSADGQMEMKNKGGVTDNEELTMEQLKNGIMACKNLFWGKSFYSIVYCVCRDCYSYHGSVSQFERELERMDFDCPAGTIINAIRNNSFMKLSIDKWRQHEVKEQVMAVVARFRETVDGLLMEKAM